jgi:hypothetical protein
MCSHAVKELAAAPRPSAASATAPLHHQLSQAAAQVNA